MKNLLFSFLLIVLFAGCKKTNSDPCYVGTWEGDLTTITEPAYSTNFFASAPTIIILNNNRGELKFTVLPSSKTSLAGYTVGIGFSYTLTGDQQIRFTGIASSYTIGSGTTALQDEQTTTFLAGGFQVNQAHDFTCDDKNLIFMASSTHLQPLFIQKWNRK